MSEADPVPAQKHRRLQFSLRAILIAVAILGLWLGYHLHWISERREARAWLGMHSNRFRTLFHLSPKPEATLPWMLGLLGEEPLWIIDMRIPGAEEWPEFRPVSDNYLELVRRVESLFPEARVISTERKSPPDTGDSGPR